MFVSETLLSVCIDFVVMFTVGLGLVGAFFILKGQNYVQTGISLGMFLTLDWFLAKKYLLNK